MERTRETEDTKRHRILFIGLDGIDSSVLEEGIEAGLYPTLAELKRRGAWGRLDAPAGFGNGAIWPSVATGISPAAHGRYFYQQIHPGSYGAVSFDPHDLTATPVWERMSDQGDRVAVLDLPKVGVPEHVNGVVVTDWISHGGVYHELRSEPPEFAEELARRFGRNPLPRCDHPGDRDASEMESFLEVMEQRVDQRELCTQEMWKSGDFDLMISVFAEGHCTGHQAWHLRDTTHPQHDPALTSRVGDGVSRIYQRIDAAVGRLLEGVDDDTVVLCCAITGMGPNYSGNYLLDEVVRRLEGVKSSRRVAWTREAKLLAKRWLPRGIRQRGRPFKRRFEEGLAGTDRSRAHAFVIPHNENAGAIRLNLAGREPQGILRPEDADAHVAFLTEKLLALRNADTGGPVVDEVVPIHERMEGAYLENLPDLFVIWSQAAPIDRVVSDDIGEVEYVFRSNRTGGHNTDCSFFAAGPGVEVGEVQGASIYDVAPTLAAIRGIDSTFGQGKIIERLLSGAG